MNWFDLYKSILKRLFHWSSVGSTLGSTRIIQVPQMKACAALAIFYPDDLDSSIINAVGMIWCFLVVGRSIL
jgi:hypothetical protein